MNDPGKYDERLVELKCRNCGSQLSPADISPQLAAARCQHCHALFAIDLPAARAIPRPEVQLPKRFTMEERMDGLVIRRRWLGAQAFFLLFFAVIWNGFLVVWHAVAISQGAWAMSVFGLLHTGVGLFLIYLVLGMFLNTTEIRAGRTLEVRIGPLPWKGNKTIAPEEVEQFYCLEKISHGKNGSSASYKVEAVLKGNRRETFVAGLQKPEEALFVEQRLEKHLGIRDVPVAGEHGR